MNKINNLWECRYLASVFDPPSESYLAPRHFNGLHDAFLWALNSLGLETFTARQIYGL